METKQKTKTGRAGVTLSEAEHRAFMAKLKANGLTAQEVLSEAVKKFMEKQEKPKKQ